MSEATFSLATALPASRTSGSTWWSAIVRFFTADDVTSVESTSMGRPYTDVGRRCEYLENAAMRRAMGRL